MKNRAIICICLIVTLLFGICIGAGAAGGLETISAYLTYNTKVKLDGQLQNLYDGNGNQVYPINYQGTTYLPIRAISNLLGIDVGWDGATKTVLLGKTGEAKNFVEELKPYAYNNIIISTSVNPNPKEIAGKTYSTYLRGGVNSYAKYDLGGKYETFTFSSYTSSDLSGEDYIQIFGDNDELLGTISIVPTDLPKEHTVDISGVTQLTIKFTHTSNYYIFDATIE